MKNFSSSVGPGTESLNCCCTVPPALPSAAPSFVPLSSRRMTSAMWRGAARCLWSSGATSSSWSGGGALTASTTTTTTLATYRRQGGGVGAALHHRKNIITNINNNNTEAAHGGVLRSSLLQRYHHVLGSGVPRENLAAAAAVAAPTINRCSAASRVPQVIKSTSSLVGTTHPGIRGGNTETNSAERCHDHVNQHGWRRAHCAAAAAATTPDAAEVAASLAASPPGVVASLRTAAAASSDGGGGSGGGVAVGGSHDARDHHLASLFTTCDSRRPLDQLRLQRGGRVGLHRRRDHDRNQYYSTKNRYYSSSGGDKLGKSEGGVVDAITSLKRELRALHKKMGKELDAGIEEEYSVENLAGPREARMHEVINDILGVRTLRQFYDVCVKLSTAPDSNAAIWLVWNREMANGLPFKVGEGSGEGFLGGLRGKSLTPYPEIWELFLSSLLSHQEKGMKPKTPDRKVAPSQDITRDDTRAKFSHAAAPRLHARTLWPTRSLAPLHRVLQVRRGPRWRVMGSVRRATAQLDSA